MFKPNFILKAVATASTLFLCSTSSVLADTPFTLQGVVSDFRNKIFPDYPDPPNFGANSLFKGSYTLTGTRPPDYPGDLPDYPGNCRVFELDLTTCGVINEFSLTFGNSTYTNLNQNSNGFFPYPGLGDQFGNFYIYFVANDIPDPTTFNKPGRGQVHVVRRNGEIFFFSFGEVCNEGICDGDENGESWFAGNIKSNETQPILNKVPEPGFQSSILALGFLGATLLINKKCNQKSPINDD